MAPPSTDHRHESTPPGRQEVVLACVTWNSAAVLPGWIRAAQACRSQRAGISILVVDNDSSDGCPQVARDAGVPVLETGANLGYAAAINAALRVIDPGAHVLVLNPDAHPEPGCLDAMLAELDDPAVGLVVPRIVDEDGNTQPSLRRAPSIGRAWGEALLGGRRAAARPNLTEVVPVDAGYDLPQDVDWATGAAVLIGARARDELGLWDPTFFLYSEETEYLLRARALGWRVRYCPTARVLHLGGEMHASPALWSLAVANKVGLYRRSHGPVASLAFQAGLLANEVLRAPRSPVHRAAVGAAVRPSAVPRPGQQGVVAFAGVDWWYHNRAHSDVQLLRRIAAQRPVLMVNSIGLRVPRPGRSTQPWRRIARKAASLARYVRTPDPTQPNFHTMTPLALPVYGNDRVRAASAAFTRWQVERVARYYLLARPHLLVTIPSADRVVAGMPRASLTFNRSDLQSAFPEADNARIVAMEEELLRDSDLVVYVSHELIAHDAPLVGDRAHFLDHGVDVAHFTRTQGIPEDIAAIPGPRIGFFGGLDDYVVDFDLIEHLARALPEMSVVLIGDATCSMERLEALPNLHWLGMRPYEHIPAYGTAFDVAIMPWLANDWIRFCNPIKLKEYLALGLPVVSTDFPELAHFGDVVAVASDPEAFVELVRREAGTPQDEAMRARRRQRVVGDTWEAKADELLDLLDDLAGTRARTRVGAR